jgi:hypothetical protein
LTLAAFAFCPEIRSRSVVSKPGFGIKVAGAQLRTCILMEASRKGTKVSNINLFFCHTQHVLVTCCHANVQKSFKQLPNHVLSSAFGYSAVLNAIQSIFSYSNQVLSAMHHTAVTSYSFVCSSFFSKQLLTTSIWPKVASKGCGAKLCKKVCQAPLQMTTSSSPLLKVLKRLPHDITMQCVSFNNITIFPIDL